MYDDEQVVGQLLYLGALAQRNRALHGQLGQREFLGDQFDVGVVQILDVGFGTDEVLLGSQIEDGREIANRLPARLAAVRDG